MLFRSVSQSRYRDAGRQTITWAKHVNQYLNHAEDGSPRYYNIPIEALCYYNAFRNWPINKATVSGELDDFPIFLILLVVFYAVSLAF